MSELKETKNWRSVLMFVVVLLMVPLTVVCGMMLDKRAYLPISIVIVILSMIPFFTSFERRKPQARELVTLAVMIALAVASRAVFAFVPHFKPMAGVVMITGIAFGASSGFLAGSLSAFVSNFIFGQGPWTPFQMLAFGLCGFVFGFLSDFKKIPRAGWSVKQRIIIGIGAGLFVLVVAGPVLNTSTLFWMTSNITPESILAIYLAGVPVDAVHGLATAVTVILVGNPILEKLQRLRKKYGI